MTLFVFTFVFVIVFCPLIVSVNNHCDYVRDIGSIFVCMTVIMIVSNFDRFLIHFLFIVFVFVFQPVLYL